jgi:biopolymer transport protein ExbB/TolQ
MDVVIKNTLLSFNPSQAGWQFMWIICIAGAIGFGFAIERFVYIFLKSSKGRDKFVKDFGGMLASKNFEGAIKLAADSKFPLAKMLGAVVSTKDKGRDAMVEASDAIFLTEAPRVNRYLSIVGMFGNVCTLLGLMGTIFGLIITFDAVANKPAAERPIALANGISVAMGTTLLGLFFAIPLLLVQGWLLMLAERVCEEMESSGLKLINNFDNVA